MKVITKLITTSIGKKFLMAVTGAIWIGFLTVHLLGNLQIFAGPDAMNQYAFNLQNLGALKWAARGIFVVSFFIHIVLAILLKKENSSARPSGYVVNATVKASAASRSMILSGSVILFFLAYHILHYTLGIAHSEYFGHMDYSGRHDVFFMMVKSFQNPAVSFIYIASIALVSLHLSHAFASMFQTLGLNGVRSEIVWKKTGYIFSVLIFIGFISIPIGVLTGIIH